MREVKVLAFDTGARSSTGTVALSRCSLIADRGAGSSAIGTALPTNTGDVRWAGCSAPSIPIIISTTCIATCSANCSPRS